MYYVSYEYIYLFVQADALILAVAGGSELFARTQQIYFHKHKSRVSRVRLWQLFPLLQFLLISMVIACVSCGPT